LSQPFLPCTSLEEAIFAALLFAGGVSGAELIRFQSCWLSPDDFLLALPRLPPALLEAERARDFYAELVRAPRKYLPRLVRCLNTTLCEPRRARPLALLFSPQEIAGLARGFPDALFPAFDWCLAVLTFYNHCGEVEESERWSRCAGELKPLVEAPEICKSVNRDFVGQRFNRYHFRPEPTPELARALEVEEEKQSRYRESNAVLGAIYGTLAQNYGFCGPAFLDSLLEMSARARRAFGRKYRGEAERLLNYETYGLLDAGRPDEAGECLRKYLGLPVACGLDLLQAEASRLLSLTEEPAAPYKLALLYRFLADLGHDLPRAQLRGALSAFHSRRGHPWPLIALNLGRLALFAGMVDEAGELLRHSAYLCGQGGDTLRPMGLLALAELEACGRAKEEDFAAAREIVAWIGCTPTLHRDHFASLLALQEGADILATARREREKLFPFSYR